MKHIISTFILMTAVVSMKASYGESAPIRRLVKKNKETLSVRLPNGDSLRASCMNGNYSCTITKSADEARELFNELNEVLKTQKETKKLKIE